MAHIVASITVFVNTPLLYHREGTPLQTQGLPPMPCSFAANGGQQVMFSGIFMSYPNKGICSGGNKVDY